MQDNYKEILQAVIEGKQLQFREKGSEGLWVNDYENDGSAYRTKQILTDLVAFEGYEYRVKPEKKVFKYQTRAFINDTDKVIVWTSTDHYTQQTTEGFATFSRWLEPTQDHEVVYE